MSPKAPNDRDLDLILWGATGFTGQLVAEYLATHPDLEGRAWALAGRNEAKLARVRDGLLPLNPALADLPLLVGDSLDRSSLDALAARARVICTTVGPYAKYGSPLVAACVDHGTHYCDLTGEVHWVRQMLDLHHEAARQSGARITHFCGFDSIPSDLGVALLQSHAADALGGPCERVLYGLRRASGGFSGGTIASMLGTLDALAEDPSLRRVLGHPYALNPDGERSGPDGGDLSWIRHDPLAGAWVAPFIMSRVNTRVVRRSNALLGYPYGRDFRYEEVTLCGDDLSGAARAASLAVGLGGFALALSLSPTRALLERFVLPDPGEGPSREKIDNGFLEVILHGQRGDDTLRVRVRASRDPGYGATSHMLAESALCLALDELDTPGGVLTPATAMGLPLIERLRTHGGMTFDVLDD